jgi:drug/metabolite transporter (DMT)-like permease
VPPADDPGWRAWGAFFGCALIWGSTFLVIRIGNQSLPPLWAVTVRLALAAPLLVALTYASGERLPRGAAAAAAAGFGFFNMGLSMGLLYWGEQWAPSGLTAVLYATIPLSTSLFARAYGLESLSPFKLAGALVAIGGVATIFAGSFGGAVPPAALVAVTLAAVSAAFSGVLLKRGPRQHPFGANAVASLVGCAMCGTASFALGERHPLPTTADQLLPVLYLAIAGSIGAFGLYAWLVNHWPVSRISFVSVVVPLVALVLGGLFAGERLTVQDAVGSALVLAGLGLALLGDRVWRARA